MKAAFVLLLTLATSTTVDAAPLRLRNVTPLRVALDGRHQPGVGLKMKNGGWRLQMSEPAVDAVEAVDVTAGAHSARWTMELRGGAVVFDGERFIAGHAYRLVARSGTTTRGTALVYLYPPKVAAKSHVSFASDSDGADDGELHSSKKPTL